MTWRLIIIDFFAIRNSTFVITNSDNSSKVQLTSRNTQFESSQLTSLCTCIDNLLEPFLVCCALLKGILPGDRYTGLSSVGGTWLLSGNRESDCLCLVKGVEFGVTGKGAWLCIVKVGPQPVCINDRLVKLFNDL